MTNEELLYEIEHHWAGSLESGKRSWAGLAAVVKLHKPIWRGCSEPTCCGNEDTCRCGFPYPCETIKAIEAALYPHPFGVNLDEVWIDRATGQGHCGDSCACQKEEQ